MSDEIVAKNGTETRSGRRIIIKEIITEVVRKTEITKEIEVPEGKPIVESMLFEPLPYAKVANVSNESPESMSIDDSECRKELIRLLGLQEPLGRSADAFDELDGLFDDIVEAEGKVDVTKWVRSLRSRK